MRIAWLAPGPGFSKPGGLRYMGSLYKTFIHAFPQTIFYTTAYVHPIYRNHFKTVTLNRLKIITLKNRGEGYYDKNIQVLPLRIVYYLLRHRPHVIITSAFNTWTILCVILKIFLRSRIIVLWDGSSPSIDRRENWILLFLRKLISKRIDCFFTNTKSGEEYLHSFLAAKNVVQWPYQVPDILDLLSSSKNNLLIKSSRPRFIYVGQLIPQKGIELLLQAWAIVHAEIKGSLLILGSGNSEKELKEQALSKGLDDVHFLGYVEYGNLGSYFKNCDVFVFPSLEDIWGMVVLEAMAFSLPILCSKYAGASELVKDGENGFVFDPLDQKSFVELLKKVADRSDIRLAFGARSKHIIDEYTIENAVRQLCAAIDNINIRTD